MVPGKFHRGVLLAGRGGREWILTETQKQFSGYNNIQRSPSYIHPSSIPHLSPITRPSMHKGYTLIQTYLLLRHAECNGQYQTYKSGKMKRTSDVRDRMDWGLDFRHQYLLSSSSVAYFMSSATSVSKDPLFASIVIIFRSGHTRLHRLRSTEAESRRVHWPRQP